MKGEYGLLLSYLLWSAGLGVVVFAVSYLLVPRESSLEKVSAYECGFDPFSDARGKFDVRFYLVAILFIIFDLEITFLFPWSVSLSNVNLFGYLTMIYFLWILLVGFVYEWQKGALEWE